MQRLNPIYLMVKPFKMSRMWRWVVFSITIPVLLVSLIVTGMDSSEYRADYDRVVALYNESIAYWNFENISGVITDGSDGSWISEGFCQIDGIHEQSQAVKLTSASSNSAKITMSSYPSDCPTDPLQCADGFTVAFWLRLKEISLNDTLDTDDCMLLSLNDTSDSHNGFQIVFSGRNQTIYFQALGVRIGSTEAFDATDSWFWNHLGMTWNNNTQNISVYSNGEQPESGSPRFVKLDYPKNSFGMMPGCNYTALDEIAIWNRSLDDEEMIILRLDRFNESMEPPEETTQEPTTTLPTTTLPTTTEGLTNLEAAYSKIKETNDAREILKGLQFVHENLSQSDTVPPNDGKIIKNILNTTSTKISFMVPVESRKSVLMEYMAIVNEVLKINMENEKSLIGGDDLSFAVDKLLSSYINSENDTGDDIKHPLVDAKLSSLPENGGDITLKLQKCQQSCSENYDIVILIPRSIFMGRSGGQASAFSFYDGFQKNLPTKVLEEDNKNHTVSSVLVGINVNAPSSSNLTDNVTITIRFNGYEESNETAKCAFLKRKGAGAVWSTDGIESSVDEYDKTLLRCKCSHLTNFAVLVSPRELNISKEDTLALQILTDVGLGISIICLILTLIILNVLRQLNSTRISILKHTAAALLIAQILFIVGSAVSQVTELCTAVAALLHYFFLAVFCWMLIQGVQLYMKVRRALRGHIDMIYFYLFGWGFPAIVVAISVGISHQKYIAREGICWISVDNGSGALIAFLGPAYLILSINMVVLCMVMHVFMTVKVNKDKSEMDKLKSGCKAIMVMIPILGLTWLFGVLITLSAEVVFLYLFVIFNCSQGVFIFLFHVVFNDEVKEALHKKRNKIAASKDSNSFFSKVLKSKSGSEQTTEATVSSSIH